MNQFGSIFENTEMPSFVRGGGQVASVSIKSGFHDNVSAVHDQTLLNFILFC